MKTRSHLKLYMKNIIAQYLTQLNLKIRVAIVWKATIGTISTVDIHDWVSLTRLE